MKQGAGNQPSARPAKVLFLITKATWGGAQRYVYDIATNIPHGQYIPIVAYGQPGKLSEKLAQRSIRVRPLSDLGRDIDLFSDIRSFFQIWSLIRSERPLILHLNSSKAAALGAIAGRFSGVPRIVFTVHGWPFKESRGPLSSAMIRAISWLTAYLSDVVIVVSKEDERIGMEMRGIETKIRYVPLGVEVTDFLPRDMASLVLPLSGADWPRLVTIAELTPNKGLAYALEAILLLKEFKTDVSYFVIGEGEERERLEVQAQSMQIMDRVHFLGFIPDAARYLKAFDLFILPSIKEGMPYVLLEAAIAGLPIISTDVVDPMFSQLSPAAVSIRPGDPKELADAILKNLHAHAEQPPTGIAPLSQMIEQTIACYTTAPTISVSSRA